MLKTVIWLILSVGGVYNSLKLALTLDFETLTKDDKKKLIDELLVKMITDDNSEQNINGLVSDQYVSAVKNALYVIKVLVIPLTLVIIQLKKR